MPNTGSGQGLNFLQLILTRETETLPCDSTQPIRQHMTHVTAHDPCDSTLYMCMAAYNRCDSAKPVLQQKTHVTPHNPSESTQPIWHHITHVTAHNPCDSTQPMWQQSHACLSTHRHPDIRYHPSRNPCDQYTYAWHLYVRIDHFFHDSFGLTEMEDIL